jgi:hypothetical protein
MRGSRAPMEPEKGPKRRLAPESGKSYPVAISVVPSAERPATVPRARNSACRELAPAPSIPFATSAGNYLEQVRL